MIAAISSVIAAVRQWLAEELRLIALDSWSDGRYHGPPSPPPCSAGDPRCQRTIERLAEVAERMKRMKARVLDGRTFTSSAATDVRATFDAIRRVTEPPVQLVKPRLRGKA